jgi:hypothetical protein
VYFRYIAIFLFITLLNVVNTAQAYTKTLHVIERYDIEAKVNAERDLIEVKAIITMILNGEESIALTLNRSADINKITIDSKDIEFIFDKKGNTPNEYIDNGRLLTINQKTNDKIKEHKSTVELEY